MQKKKNPAALNLLGQLWLFPSASIRQRGTGAPGQGGQGALWVRLVMSPGQNKQTKEQTSKQAIRKKKGGEKVTEGLLNIDHLTWRAELRP